jgi:hypothetical protein
MAFLGIRKLDDAPILISTFSGYISEDDLNASDQVVPEYLAPIQQDVVMIIDVRGGTSSFAEVLHMLKHGAPQQNVGEFPFQIHMFLVGTDAMAKLYVDAARLKQFGAQHIPMFASLDAAIAAARQRTASQTVAQHRHESIHEN